MARPSDDERASLLHRGPDDEIRTSEGDYSPEIVTKVVTRVKALIHDFLPVPVEAGDLTSPTSSLITPSVVDLLLRLPGSYPLCLPFALLSAARTFSIQAHDNPSDADVLLVRSLAAEALAQKVVAHVFKADKGGNERGYETLGRRFQTVNEDGDESLPRSALESAVDQNATFFLSSNEVQQCVFALWKGLLVQTFDKDGSVHYRPHYESRRSRRSFIESFDPVRIGVPRYQYVLRLFMHILFLVVYSVAVQTPQRGLSPEDVVLYVMVLGYIAEGLVKVRKIGMGPSMTWWTSVNIIMYTLMIVALVYRIADMVTTSIEKSDRYRLLSFQWLSCAAPLMFAKLVTIFDMHKFFGILQIVVFRMLRSSSIFFALLAILGVGFAQALAGLDIDEKHSMAEPVVHHLMQALLGSPAFDKYERPSDSYPFGIILYYSWSTLTLVILLNILIALFGSAYSECTEDAGSTFLAFFASKTLAAIRAPDTFVYVAPMNLIEGIFIAPLERVLPKKTYTTLNRHIMTVLFFLPICCIAFYESRFEPRIHEAFEQLQDSEREVYGDEDRDPDLHESSSSGGVGKICQVSFAELKKGLPDAKISIQDEILEEIRALRRELRDLREERTRG